MINNEFCCNYDYQNNFWILIGEYHMRVGVQVTKLSKCRVEHEILYSHSELHYKNNIEWVYVM